MDNDAVPSRLMEQCAEAVASFVRKMFFPEQGVAEGQSGGNTVFLHQCQNFSGVVVPKPHTASAPDAICRCAVDGANVAPVIEIFPVFPEKGQKDTVELIELEQAGEMVMYYHILYITHVFFHPLFYNNVTLLFMR